MLSPHDPLPPAVALRIVHQAPVGELTLTIDEAASLIAYLTFHPRAAVALGPGRIVEIRHLPVNVLPDLDLPAFPL